MPDLTEQAECKSRQRLNARITGPQKISLAPRAIACGAFLSSSLITRPKHKKGVRPLSRPDSQVKNEEELLLFLLHLGRVAFPHIGADID